MKNVWQLQEAKNQFSLVVDNALTQGPQTVTRHGEPTVMVVSMAEFKKARPKKSLVQMLLRSPLRGLDVDFERQKDFPREVEL